MSKKIIAVAGVIILTGLLMFMAGCFSETTETTETQTTETTETASTENESPIKKFDFKNFSFPLEEKDKDGKDLALTLKDGKLEKSEKSAGATLGKIQYADLNGDKTDEAIIKLSVEGEKDAKSTRVYIYTLEDEKPKLLWNFETAGGEEKGLKAISAEEGNLVVEMFGEAKFEKGKWELAESKDKKQYTKTALKWNGKEFAVEGDPKVLDVEEKEKAEEKSA